MDIRAKIIQLLSFIYLFPANVKISILKMVDIAVVFGAFWFVCFVAEPEFTIFINNLHILSYITISLVTFLSFIYFDTYHNLLKTIRLRSLKDIIIISIISTLSLFTVNTFQSITLHESLYLLYLLIINSAFIGVRILIRVLYKELQHPKNVIIYGAGEAGLQLSASLNNGGQYRPVAFIDDNSIKQKQIVNGLKVFDKKAIKNLLERFNVSTILIAIPSLTGPDKQAILESLSQFSVQVKMIPSYDEIISGDSEITSFKDVEIEDLLGRRPILPNVKYMRSAIHNKTILITGAGGSIGSELCRQILKYSPKKLVLFELCEFNLYTIDRELHAYTQENGLNSSIISILGDVNDSQYFKHVLSSNQVDSVYHAAAYKHVPIVESNVLKGVQNNTLGTNVVANACGELAISSFILVSTDKAVRPTNFMGASKRLAELIVQAHAEKYPNTKFNIVRFGNVLGSSGSVVPLFKKQIASGGPVTVTDPEVTRFFMTIPEAAQLIIQAGCFNDTGKVYVLDMGDSIKIVDLAKKLIHLSGYTIKNNDLPAGDIEIKFTGLRAGEKLFEELFLGHDLQRTFHRAIYCASEEKLPWEQLAYLLIKLELIIKNNNITELKYLLANMKQIQYKSHLLNDLDICNIK